MYDFNDADQQRGGELIPDKTIAKLMFSIRPAEQALGMAYRFEHEPMQNIFPGIHGAGRTVRPPQALAKPRHYGGKTNDKGQSIAARFQELL
jgi:hypothetical protein